MPVVGERGSLDLKGPTMVYEDIPDYFQVGLKELPKSIGFKKIKQYPGFRIDFKDVESLDGYLGARFGKSSRYKLRRAVKKLESCFEISYRMYFGEMTRQEYDFVFEEFYRLLEIRSHEKGIKNNRNLKTKHWYYEQVYPMILEKKASFYVIFDRGIPIDICLNFHLDNVLFQFIRTYDICYSKFNTGYINLMNQITWCLENGVASISFSKGDFYWKRRWCNSVYNYNYHVFYKRNSLRAALTTHAFLFMLGLRQWLREKGIINRYHQFRDTYLIKPSGLSAAGKIEGIYDPEEGQEAGAEIDYRLPEFTVLRRAIYEYLFESEDTEKHLNVFRLKKTPQHYWVKGMKSDKIFKFIP
jgi:hypothetical protein